MPTPEARIARARRTEGLALFVAAVTMLGTVFAFQAANDAQETADVNRAQQCRDFGRALSAQTRRLAVFKNGDVVPESTRVYHSRLSSLRDSLIETKKVDCTEIKDYGRRRLNKLIEIEQRLGLTFDRGGKSGKGTGEPQTTFVPGSTEESPTAPVTGTQGPSGSPGRPGRPGTPGAAPPSPSPAPVTTTPDPTPSPTPSQTSGGGVCSVTGSIGLPVCIAGL